MSCANRRALGVSGAACPLMSPRAWAKRTIVSVCVNTRRDVSGRGGWNSHCPRWPLWAWTAGCRHQFASLVLEIDAKTSHRSLPIAWLTTPLLPLYQCMISVLGKHCKRPDVRPRHVAGSGGEGGCLPGFACRQRGHACGDKMPATRGQKAERFA